MKKLMLTTAALAVAIPCAVVAQGTPEQVATQYLQTMKAADWAGNAALIHPVEQDSLKAAVLEVIASDTSTAGLRQVFNVASAAELRALPAQQVYQRFVANTIGTQPGMREMLAAASFTAIGHVDQGDTSYVVYRVTAQAEGNTLSQVTVLSLRRDGGGWKVRLPEELKGMMMGMRQAAAQRRAAAAAIQPSERPAAPPTAPPARPATPPAAPPARP
ncbi:hypothetical protein [Longimicrobium sp.]|uniref:hypothetical protein n=1 Tax=Longimicrobium sp. TaxID=2029185 RepID=UPI002B7C281C|nr:hypothetical protein [Longimicrobium sp.]HSU16725.1 hypothetical protein [Longimicrobium sp.]